jgi:hypothetical protein
MRTPNIIKAIGLTLGLAVSVASTAAHAGDYGPVTATAPQYFTISGTRYLCFSVMAPVDQRFDWCLPATDPAAAGMTTIVANAFERNHVLYVGCASCGSIAGDAKWPGTKWVPEYVFVGSQGRAYPN